MSNISPSRPATRSNKTPVGTCLRHGTVRRGDRGGRGGEGGGGGNGEGKGGGGGQGRAEEGAGHRTFPFVELASADFFTSLIGMGKSKIQPSAKPTNQPRNRQQTNQPNAQPTASYLNPPNQWTVAQPKKEHHSPNQPTKKNQPTNQTNKTNQNTQPTNRTEKNTRPDPTLEATAPNTNRNT